MHVRKAAFLNKGKALGKLLLRLPREGHDHIRGDGAVRKILIQKAHTFIVAGGVIFALHPLQNRVTAALHAQMELMAQIGQRRQPSAKLLGDNSGFQRTQAHPKLRHRLTDGFNQPCHLGLARQIHSPAGNFDACHHNFPVPPSSQILGLLHRQLHRSRANRPPGVGDNTVGTEIDAAVLHFQHGPGPLFQAAGGQNFKFSPAQSIVQAFQMGAVFQCLEHLLHKSLPSAAAADDVYPKLTHILRRVLAVAAADADHRFGVVPAAPADYRPVFLVRHCGYGAGIDDITVTDLVKRHNFMAFFCQKSLHCLGFVLICFAS